MPSSTLNTNTLSSVVDNTLDVYGVTGFIVSNGGSFSISSSFNANVFTFTTSSAFIYLGFSYFFISAPLCSDCAGYPIPYNGVCYSNCPAGTYMVNGSCISCPAGQIWNGNACVPNTPQCPNGMIWNGTACVYPTLNAHRVKSGTDLLVYILLPNAHRVKFGMEQLVFTPLLNVHKAKSGMAVLVLSI